MRILKPNTSLKQNRKNKIRVNDSGVVSFEGVVNSDKSHLELGMVSKGVQSLQSRKHIKGAVKKQVKNTKHQEVVFENDGFQENNCLQLEQELKESQQKKEYLYLYNKAIHLLSMREHSEQEIETKLANKSDRHDLISVVINELLENNYLSNDRFTESYVRSRKEKGFGPTKIRMDLISKGIKNNMICEYLRVDSFDWYDGAQRLYDKKYKGETICDYNNWTKRARFMQSRGFTMDHIHSVLPPVETD